MQGQQVQGSWLWALPAPGPVPHRLTRSWLRLGGLWASKWLAWIFVLRVPVLLVCPCVICQQIHHALRSVA